MKILNFCTSRRVAINHSAIAVAVGIGLGSALAAPANDDFVNAITLPGISGVNTGTNNNGATLETGEPSHPDTVDTKGTNTVWFKWTSPSSGDFTFKTDGSANTGAGDWDSVIGIYTGASVTALTPLGATQQDTGGPESMTIPVTGGATYYIQLAGYRNEEASNIKLTWSFKGPADIITFGPGAAVGNLVANAAAITWNLPLGTNKATLQPTFTLSPGATCTVSGNPVVSGDLVNLTNPVDFVITAAGPSPIVNTYTVTVNLIAPTGIINVSYEAGSIPDPSLLVGPAGGSGETWNQPVSPSGSGLLDSVGTATSVGWSNTDMGGIDNWGNPGLKMIRSGMRNFATGTSQQFVINGLTVGAYYNVWLASANPDAGQKSKGEWTITNTTTTLGSQAVDNTINHNTSTWETGNNYVFFANVEVNGSGTIVLNGVSAASYRLPVNGFQLVPTTLPATDYGIWASGYLPSDVSVSTADFDGDGQTNQQEYAFDLNPTSGSSVNPIRMPLDASVGTFGYARRDPALTGLAYTVWTSTNLITWTIDAGAVQTPDAPVNGVELVSVTLSSPLLTSPQLFVRINAE